MDEKVTFEPKITLETPVADYQHLVKTQLQVDELVDDDVLEERYRRIAAAARDTVWKLLFGEKKTDQAEAKAAELLAVHKGDACFYAPWEYNKWIVGVRDELLKRQMLDFWRKQMVARELGPCWAKDSDYFDDYEDPEPAAFYKHAGCVAPFAKEPTFNAKVKETPNEEEPKLPPTTPIVVPTSPAGDTSAAPSSVPAAPLVISMATPVEDYTAKLQHQIDVDPDDEEQLAALFAEARDVIWKLLFEEQKEGSPLSAENFAKAAALLEAYKRDACFYSPYDYNSWIQTVRDELFKRKYFTFWKQVIVDKECGLCWYKDSDYFDDSEDTRPIEFLRSGDKLMKS